MYIYICVYTHVSYTYIYIDTYVYTHTNKHIYICYPPHQNLPFTRILLESINPTLAFSSRPPRSLGGSHKYNPPILDSETPIV